MLKILAPTINFQAGDIGRLPILELGDLNSAVVELVEENIEISQRDWDADETSWDFKRHPLV